MPWPDGRQKQQQRKAPVTTGAFRWAKGGLHPKGKTNHSIGMDPEDGIGAETRKQVPIGPALSLMLVPVLVVAAGISIPYSLVARQARRRRQHALQADMKSRNRAMEWDDFLRALSEHRGTVIEERSSRTTSDRWWWTPDNLYEMSPYPITDWLSMRNDANFDPFSWWCHRNYTSPETGGALLICSSQATRKKVFEAWSRIGSGNHTWVEVVPLEILPRKRRQLESQVV
jgi:hypothetical protein